MSLIRQFQKCESILGVMRKIHFGNILLVGNLALCARCHRIYEFHHPISLHITMIVLISIFTFAERQRVYKEFLKNGKSNNLTWNFRSVLVNGQGLFHAYHVIETLSALQSLRSLVPWKLTVIEEEYHVNQRFKVISAGWNYL